MTFMHTKQLMSAHPTFSDLDPQRRIETSGIVLKLWGYAFNTKELLGT